MDLNPDFAVICSFLAQFGDLIDCELDIRLLESSIQNQETISEYLLDLHVKLLKKYRRYFVKQQWEKALIRFAAEYSYEDAYQIENFGYVKTTPSLKLELLRRLMDVQFECDPKFKAIVNADEATELRQPPLGRDLKGVTYWHRHDSQGNLKIFQEKPMDLTFWSVVCSKPEDVTKLIDELDRMTNEPPLKGEPYTEIYNPWPEIFPEIFDKQIKSDKIGTNINSYNERLADEKNNILISESQLKKGRCKLMAGESLPRVLDKYEEPPSCNSTSSIKHDDNLQYDVKPILLDIKSVTNQLSRADESQIASTIQDLIDRVVSPVADLVTNSSSHFCIENPTPESISPLLPPLIETDKKPKSRKRKTVKEKLPEEVGSRRSSSRIQQLQLKKLAEDEEKKQKLAEEKKRKLESKSANGMTTILEDETSMSHSISSSRREKSRPSESPEPNSKRKRRLNPKKGKKLSWDKDDSDLSSTSSLTESEDDIDEDETFKFDTMNDDEFACEDEDSNPEPVIVKRARTARNNTILDSSQDNITIIEEDTPCRYCDESNDPEWILLCDMCDDGYHIACCNPPLMLVPDGDWYCPPCEHKKLLTKLKEFLSEVEKIIDINERERIKREKLRAPRPVKAAVLDPLPVKRERGFLSQLNDPSAVMDLDEPNSEEEPPEDVATERVYKDEEYHEDVSSSNSSADSDIREDRKRNKRGNNHSGKRNRNGHRSKPKKHRKVIISESSESDILDNTEESAISTEESEDEILKPKARRARNAVTYNFQEYDDLIKSAIQADSIPLLAAPNQDDADEEDEAEEDEEEVHESDSDQGNYGRGKDMATIEALAYQQENKLLEQRASNDQESDQSNLKAFVVAPEPEPMTATPVVQVKKKKKTRRLNDLDADSEIDDQTSDESFQATDMEADEDDEDEMTEEASPDETDTSIDELVNNSICKPKKRKHKRRRSNYDSDDSDYIPSSRGRRATSNKISYKESTDEEGATVDERNDSVSPIHLDIYEDEEDD